MYIGFVARVKSGQTRSRSCDLFTYSVPDLVMVDFDENCDTVFPPRLYSTETISRNFRKPLISEIILMFCNIG